MDQPADGRGARTPGAPRAWGLPYRALPLRTGRLLLRPFASDDLEDVLDYQRRPEVVRFLGWEPLDRPGARRHLEQRMGMDHLGHDGDWLVHAVEFAPLAGGTTRPGVVGEVMLILRSADEAQLEIGWIFNPVVQGRGIATEAARAVLDLAFERIGAHRVFAQVDPRNNASARLCERLGMRQEALFRENGWAKGEWTSTAVYARLAADTTPEDQGQRS